MSKLVHEVTHAFDHLTRILGDVYQLEKNAFFHERAFHEATGVDKDFETIKGMVINSSRQ